MAKVSGKLIANCYVGGILRQQGEEVEVAEELAEQFLVEYKEKAEAAAKAKKEALSADLNKKTKEELLVTAAEVGAEFTEDNNKKELVEKILEKVG